MSFLDTDHQLTLKIDTSELNAVQIRNLKSLTSAALRAMVANDETEYFEASAEVMNICASIIRQANFAQNLRDGDNIHYAEQAVAYSMDILEEHLGQKKNITYDN